MGEGLELDISGKIYDPTLDGTAKHTPSFLSASSTNEVVKDTVCVLKGPLLQISQI